MEDGNQEQKLSKKKKKKKTVKLRLFSYPSVLTCVLGAQKNRPFEYPQHMFRLRNKKIKFHYAPLSGVCWDILIVL